MRTRAVLVPLTALAAGLLFATSASTAQGTDLRSDRRLKLTELIGRERDAVAALEQDAVALREDVAAEQAAAASRDSRVAAVQASPELERAAGLVAMTGPGVTVELDDAPRRPGRPDLSANPDDLVVHQQDVQAVVNALWRGGAEAMTLMGQRIVSTTAVRCVGNTVIVHGLVYSPPFVVTAVGDPASMRAALDSDPGVAYYRTFVDRFGLGYAVRTEEQVELPAYTGPLELPHAVGRAGA
ncbi:MAG TPA: DUF881 domain-containing protein [Mycobacteriales bacterium]|nr:DUF881 domain-containing protein [Mycobacteriales bacterium]